MAPSFLCECHINMSPRKTKSIFRPIRLAALLMSQLFQADDGSDHDIYTGSKTATSSPGSHVQLHFQKRIPPKRFKGLSTFMAASARSGQLHLSDPVRQISAAHHRHFSIGFRCPRLCHLSTEHSESNLQPMKCSESEDTFGRKRNKCVKKSMHMPNEMTATLLRLVVST
jgi:hypothetical protein